MPVRALVLGAFVVLGCSGASEAEPSMTERREPTLAASAGVDVKPFGCLVAGTCRTVDLPRQAMEVARDQCAQMGEVVSACPRHDIVAICKNARGRHGNLVKELLYYPFPDPPDRLPRAQQACEVLGGTFELVEPR